MASRDAIRRAVEVSEHARRLVDKWPYQPPEAMPGHLWELFTFLADYVGERNATEVVHVGAILVAVDLRRASEPEFAAALDDYLASRKSGES